MIASADFHPFVNIYIESIFNKEGISAINQGKITDAFKSVLDSFDLSSQEDTRFSSDGRIKYIRVPNKLIADSRVTVKMDLSNQYTCDFALYLPDGLEWWYFIPYYGRTVIIDAGYIGSSQKTYLSRSFAGIIKTISPDFSGLIPKISFQVYDLLLQGIQQNTSYVIPSAMVENQALKFSIMAAYYSKEYADKNIFKEYAPTIWTQKYTSNADRQAHLASVSLNKKGFSEKKKEQSKKEIEETEKAAKLTSEETIGSLFSILIENK